MSDTASLLWGVLFSSIGVGYFIYGRKQQKLVPLLSGIEVARRIAGRCHVAFITSYDQHALEAFEAGAIDAPEWMAAGAMLRGAIRGDTPAATPAIFFRN